MAPGTIQYAVTFFSGKRVPGRGGNVGSAVVTSAAAADLRKKHMSVSQPESITATIWPVPVSPFEKSPQLVQAPPPMLLSTLD